MKEDDNHHPAVQTFRAACDSKTCRLLLLILSLTSSTVGPLKSQSCVWNPILYHGEQTSYELYFKWGFFMPKAGLAQFSVKETIYNNQPAWEYKLQFNTVSMFDKIFKMRDTLTTYFSPENQLLFSDKRTNEGGYYLADKMKFSTLSPARTAVHSQRYGRAGLRMDTTLIVEGCAFDMMATTLFLRAIRWKNLKVKDEFPFRVVVGKDIVNAAFRYSGQAIVAPGGQVKYRTHHFYIDVYDPAFEQSKEAAEVWIGDDENHLPIRVRAKLKIGAAEVYIRDAANLKYPFDCRILIPEK
jgi:hypothetical protein